MGKAIISLIFLLTPAAAALGATPALKDTAPDRYIVVQGDTLWSIAGRFLQKPWQWPEIWNMNRDQIRNPHRIYPGDVIIVDRSTHEARLRLEKLGSVKLDPRVRVEPLPPEPVPTIPTAAIEPFLARPLIIGANDLDAAPQVTATQENRVVVGVGAIAYVSGLKKDQGKTWQLFRRGDELRDPESNQVLGYEAVYLGEAEVLEFAEQSTIRITKSTREVFAGDRLVPAAKDKPIFGYVPHAPAKSVRAHIMSAYGSLGEAGPMSIVTLSKGSKDGLEVGHVLAILRNQNANRYELRTAPLYGRQGPAGSDAPRPYYGDPLTPRDGPLFARAQPITGEEISKLPEERYGLVMVFRTFDRAAFGIILQANRQVAINDVATNP